MGGAVAQFGIGGTVEKLSMVANITSVRVDGLSETDATSATLPPLLKSFGYELRPNETTRATKLQATKKVSVYITSDDPQFAQRFCRDFSPPRTSHIRAVCVPPKFPPGTITRKTSCRKVLVSWARPTRAVWLHFDTYAEAAIVGGRFNRGFFKLDGVVVEAGPPSAHRDKWQIMLRNAPVNVTVASVSIALYLSFEKPTHVQLGQSYDGKAAPTFVASLFRTFGNVEYISEPRMKGRWWSTAVHFEHEADARKTVEEVQDQPQEFLGSEKLNVKLMNTSMIKIARKVHDALQGQIAAALPPDSGHKVTLKVFPDSNPEDRFVNLSLQSEYKKQVAALTGTIEAMLAGKIIDVSKDGFKTLVESRNAAQELREIQKLHQVLIVTKKARKELIYFGPPARYDVVRQAVLDASKGAIKSRFTYRLSDEQYVWACANFDQITSKLGENVAWLNMTSNPSIAMNGTKDQYQQLRAILEPEKSKKKQDREEQMCSTCWTSAEDPVMLVCGHIYCAECLEELCRSSSSDNADFVITCKGASDTCKRHLSLTELEIHLSSKAFEEVLRISFASYIRRRADLYHYCPTPDCGFVYTTKDAAATSTCLNCTGITCTSCHAQHGSTSCKDYQYQQAGGDAAWNRYKEESGGKDCPKCSSYIEKIDGCNHMTCPGCSAHICWVCLAAFETAPLCYEHLRDEHGGYGIDIPDIPDEAELRRRHEQYAGFMQRAQAAGFDAYDQAGILLFAQHQHAQGIDLPDVFGPFI